MKPILMPQVGQDIPRGTVIEWLKEENEAVEAGEVILVVESEKATFEVEAEEGGVLLKILYAAGEEAEVLKPVGYIGQAGESAGDIPGEDPASPGHRPRYAVVEAVGAGTEAAGGREAKAGVSPAGEEGVSPAGEAGVSPAGEAGRVYASPSARRVAAERGIDLDGVVGTGPGGRIVKRDVPGTALVEGAIRRGHVSVPAALPEDRVVPFDKMRRKIAERLTLSTQTIPHMYVTVDVDMARPLAWREEANRGRERNGRISITHLVVHAVARALGEFPRMNSHVGHGRMIVRKHVNIGVATALEDGLLVPVIADADAKTLSGISRVTRENAEAARRGSVDPNIAGSFTVTSLGMYGVRMFLPVINPPECAILAVGAVERRVVPGDGAGEFKASEMMTLTLACDHRAVDGVYAARFIGRVKDLLEHGAELWGTEPA